MLTTIYQQRTIKMQHVDETLARAAIEIAPHATPGWIVLPHGAPETLADCTAFYNANGKMGVSPGVGNKRLFATANCNEAFDAWHDHCHVKLQASFDLDGEIRVDNCQQDTLQAWWKGSRIPVTMAAYNRASALLRAHNVGRLEYWKAYGTSPNDPRSFAYGFLAGKGFAMPVPLCGPVMDIRNEWTTYADGAS